MKAESAHARAVKLSRMYDRECSGLMLRSVDEQGLLGRYYLRREKDHFYWSEVVVLRGCSLLVHGDVDTVVFSNCYGMQRARDVVHWMARSDYDYATQKASIGGSTAKCFDPEVAFFRVLECRRQKVFSKEQASELASALDTGSGEHEFASEVYGLTSDPELCSIGMVTAPRVFMACAVLRRLKRLLTERDDVGMRNKASRQLWQSYAETTYVTRAQVTPTQQTGSI